MRQLFGKTGGIPSSKISKGTARPLTENVMREGSWNIPSVIVGVAALLCLMNNVPAGAEQVSRAGGFSPGVSPPLLTEMSVTQAGSFDGTWVLESVELYRLSDSGAKTKVDNSNLPEQNAISGVLDKITFASGKCTATLNGYEIQSTYKAESNTLSLNLMAAPLEYMFTKNGANNLTLSREYVFYTAESASVKYYVSLKYRK